MLSILEYFCYYGKLFEHERLVETCLKGIASALEYRDIKQIINQVWSSQIIQSHLELYKTKKESNRLQEYKHISEILNIIGNMTCTNISYTNILDKAGCLDIVYDVITRFYQRVEEPGNLKQLKVAIWIVSNIALDNPHIVKRLINEENGIIFQILSIVNREDLPQDLMYYFYCFISNSISDNEPQTALKLINLNVIEIIVNLISIQNLEESLESLFLLIKCGEDLINSKIHNHNIALVKYMDLGLMDILEELILRVTKQQLIGQARKMISQISYFSEQMHVGSSMDIIK